MPIAHLIITPVYAGLTALLLVCTSIFVTMGRVKYKVNLGDGGNAALLLRIRVQGNLVEYAPLALILMGLLEMGGTAAWVLHTLGIAFIAGRLLHAFAVYQGPKPGAARGIGTTATWLVILAGGVLALGLSQGMVLK